MSQMPTYGQAMYVRPLTDQQQPDTTLVVVAWVLTVLTGGYMLPWAIAATRGKSDQGTIGLLNFLLGWTVIGWIVTLVMACTAHKAVGWPQQQVVVATAPTAAPVQRTSAGWYPAPNGHGQQYWDGLAWTEHRAP